MNGDDLNIQRLRSTGTGPTESASPADIARQAAAARLAEGGCCDSTEESSSSSAATDVGLQATDETGSAELGSLASSLASTWASVAKPQVPKLDILSGLEPGVHAGAVHGAQGTTGLEPGMQAGPVYRS
jgi:hypothetical protein